MGAALEIRTDLASPAQLRRLARRERNPRTATRMLAIAGALEGKSRAEAARLAGMERQALRDAVARYNAEGLEGLRDRPKPGRPSVPTEPEQAVLLDTIFRGPDRARDGCVDWALPALCAWIGRRLGKRLRPAPACRVSSAGSTCRGRRPGRCTRTPTNGPRPPSPRGGS
jgi:transposase